MKLRTIVDQDGPRQTHCRPCHVQSHIRHQRCLIEHGVQQAQADRDDRWLVKREVIPNHHAGVDIDRKCEPGPRRPLAGFGIDHHDVDRGVVDLDDVERARGGKLSRRCQQVSQRRDVLALARDKLCVESADTGMDGPPVRRPHARCVTPLGDPLDQLGQLRSLWPEIEGLDLARDDRFAPCVE